MIKTFYIYSHRRSDNDEVFYVGKGTRNIKGKSHKSIYQRAYSRLNRNVDWSRIANLTPFTINIVEECVCDENEISDKEKKWVEKYKGIGLVNRTIGGCGVSGYKFPREVVNKIRAQRIGKNIGKDNYLSEQVYVYSSTTGHFVGYYECLTDASKNLNISRQSVKNALVRFNNYSCGYLIFREDKGDSVPPKTDGYPTWLPLSIGVYDMNGAEIGTFRTLNDLCRKLKLKPNSVSNAAKSGKPYKNKVFKVMNKNSKFNCKTQDRKIKMVMVCGTRGVGKDTFFKILSNISPIYKRVAFADNVKRMTDYLCKKIFKLHINELDPTQKEQFRPVLISTGMMGRKIDEDFWAKKVRSQITSFIDYGFVPVITDCRFTSEYHFYKEIYKDSLILIDLTRVGSPEPTEEEKIHGPEISKLADIHLNWPTNPDFTEITRMVEEIYKNNLS